MKSAPKSVLLLLTIATLASSGCQTFSLSEQDFDKQRHGQPADPEVGAVVDCAGTAAYLGAMIGALVAGAK